MKRGAYIVLAQDVVSNRLRFNENIYLGYTDGDYTPGTVTGTAGYVPGSGLTDSMAMGMYSMTLQVPTADNGYSLNMAGPPDVLRVPFHTSGVILEGLNPNSTFTVTLRTVWEVAPDYGDANGAVLVPLTQPSPAYDPIAIELYQRAVAMLPVAVPVGMNAAGDWWDWVLAALGAAATPVATMVMGPAGAVVGAAASSAINTIRNNRNGKDKEKEEKASTRQKALPAARTNDVFKPDVRPAIKSIKRKSKAKA